MPDAIPQFTPVNLITGFLGSGKTTLLRRLLAHPALADTAVLINEFGEVGLDHHLLERIDERTVLLQSGCLCCTIRSELADAMRDLHSKRARGIVPPFSRVAIESTGLADPFPVLTTVRADPVLKHHFRIGAVTTTVDAVNGTDQLVRQPESIKQVAVADVLVITKTDIAAPQSVQTLLHRIRTVNPDAPFLFSADESLDVNLLLAGGAFDQPSRSEPARSWIVAARAEAEHPHRDHASADPNRHGDDIRAFAIVLDRPLDWTVFGVWLTMLLHRHGDAVLRVKGILDIDGTSAPVAVHGVQHLVHPPVHMQAWPDTERRSRIVFIVRGLDQAAIERSLATFASLGSGVAATVA
jgi:G3E family GTPase